MLIAGVIVATILTFFFSTLNYALRDFSRSRLEEILESRNALKWLEPTIRRQQDLVFVTAVCRMVANMLILLGMMGLFHSASSIWLQYAAAFGLTGLISLMASVAIPHAIANHAAEPVVAQFAAPAHFVRILLLPVTGVMHMLDDLARSVAGAPAQAAPEEIQQEIAEVVEDGVKEGVVDEQESAMIESIIAFRETPVGQVMTERTDIVSLEVRAGIDEINKCLEESQHSRIVVYDNSLDHVVGVLYVREVLRHLVHGTEAFDLRRAVRPAMFVPESKPVRDLLREFRVQKVHIAVVLDEFGGTAGVVTVEDIVEELIGEIRDDHESAEPAMFTRGADGAFEVSARMDVESANRELGLSIPSDAGYDTVGGFASIMLGRIGAPGDSFTHENARFTVTNAQPQTINTLRVEILTVPAESRADAPAAQ